MSDTQWPRYLVFEQISIDQPHMLAGSVHAPDGEMALLNARDVFVRRPQVVSLWVARDDSVSSATVEELAANPEWLNEKAAGDRLSYMVFTKVGHKGTHKHAGDVLAGSAGDALRQAVHRFDDQKIVVWWVLPERSVTRSTPEDIALMFEQAETKHFRHQSDFHVKAMMAKIRQEAAKSGGEQP